MATEPSEPEVLPPRVGSGAAANIEQVGLDRLANLDRLPFVKMLADLIACAPDMDTARKFARKHPDRYFYSLKVSAGLAGFTDRVEHRGTIRHVGDMSDGELLLMLEKLKADAPPIHHPMKDRRETK